MEAGALIWLVVFLAGIFLLYIYAKTGRFFRCLFTGAFSGLGSLGLMWMASHFFEMALTVTPFTIVISALFGVPGTVGMLLLPLIG